MDRQRLHHLDHAAIENALRNLYPDPWLPKLTVPLVKWGYRTLREHTGIIAADYGTERVLTRTAEAPRHEGGSIRVPIADDGCTFQIRIEYITQTCLKQYQDIGLRLYSPNEIACSAVLPSLEEAVAVLAEVPTLQASVAALVRTCHILKPKNEFMDVSYSDPLVPFSVFVSVPRGRGPTNALRVAESLVHEAMHLQLSLIERLLPLVGESDQAWWSPWKGTHRPAQGILHALYVFRVVDSFLGRLLRLSGWTATAADYMRQRRCEIARQISELKSFKFHPGLTVVGTCFAGGLLVYDE